MITLRDTPTQRDLAAVRRIVAATGFFSPSEIEIAVELVQERLGRGPVCGYFFVFADQGGELAGYACYGPIPCTLSSFDLYWIVVDATRQRSGLGRRLLRECELRIAAAGGTRVYAETSSRPQYAPTRRFYERCGYHAAATLCDFYAPGDGKVVYERVLSSPAQHGGGAT
jgi:GNAT superfamily N-acetyltransferase